MTNSFVEEDFEREPIKDSLYLLEAEHDMWLWWHEIMKRQEGEIIILKEEENEYSEIPEFIREGMES